MAGVFRHFIDLLVVGPVRTFWKSLLIAGIVLTAASVVAVYVFEARIEGDKDPTWLFRMLREWGIHPLLVHLTLVGLYGALRLARLSHALDAGDAKRGFPALNVDCPHEYPTGTSDDPSEDGYSLWLDVRVTNQEARGVSLEFSLLLPILVDGRVKTLRMEGGDAEERLSRPEEFEILSANNPQMLDPPVDVDAHKTVGGSLHFYLNPAKTRRLGIDLSQGLWKWDKPGSTYCTLEIHDRVSELSRRFTLPHGRRCADDQATSFAGHRARERRREREAGQRLIRRRELLALEGELRRHIQTACSAVPTAVGAQTPLMDPQSWAQDWIFRVQHLLNERGCEYVAVMFPDPADYDRPQVDVMNTPIEVWVGQQVALLEEICRRLREDADSLR